jgi:putrescine transport system permease protein
MSQKIGSSRLTHFLLVAGFLFLYLPMLSLIIYSFNESRLVTVWSGFSVKWYGELFRDEQMMAAAWVSLRIAFFTACASVVLGTMAAMAITRFHHFRGRTIFGALITAPLVMPEVITGLSLLLLFVAVASTSDWMIALPASLRASFAEGGISPWEARIIDLSGIVSAFGSLISILGARSMVTIWIAHVTFCMSFVTVVVSSRLKELDRSLEEAAMDLGANRVKVFFVITLPIILPALIAGWLMAFTLSLDDLVIANFTSGPASTTLPMRVWSSMRLGVNPKINALATLMIVAVSIAAVIAWWLMSRDEKRRQLDIQMALQQG